MSRVRPRETWRDLALLGLAAFALFGLRLGARDLWAPNEPLFGRAAVEMARAGEWVVPTVNGEPFVEKPILYFWLARMAGLAAGGLDEAVLRLPSVAAGVAAVLFVYLLVLPYSGPSRARIAAAVLATIQVVFWSARTVQMDLLLAACMLGVVAAASRVLDHGLAPARGFSLGGLAAGAAFLAKGPVGLVLPALVIGGWLLATGRTRELCRPQFLLAFVVCALVALPWPVALWLREGTGALGELLWRQNVTRVLEPWDHARPAWYYLVYFWIDMLPWSPLVPLAARLPERDEGERRLDRLAWLWIAIPIALFSLSPSKRSVYILPVAPAVAVLVSGLLERVSAGLVERWRARAVSVVLAALGVILVGAGLWGYARFDERWPELGGVAFPVVALSVVAGALLVATPWLPARARLAGPAALGAYAIALYAWAAIAVLPALDRYKSSRPFARAVNAIVAPGEPLRAWHAWRWRARYIYYTDRPIRQFRDLDELREYWERPERVFLIVERGELPEVRSVIGGREPLLAADVGDNRAFLFSNR